LLCLGSVLENNLCERSRKDFVRLIKANLEYNYYRYNYSLLTKECASYIRNTVSESLRSKEPMQVGSLVCGMDNDTPNLFLIDQLGSMEKVTKGVLGYASHFLYGLMDDCYKKDFNLSDGKSCIKKCILELKTRFLLNIVNFDVFLVNKEGVEDISKEFNN